MVQGASVISLPSKCPFFDPDFDRVLVCISRRGAYQPRKCRVGVARKARSLHVNASRMMKAVIENDKAVPLSVLEGVGIDLMHIMQPDAVISLGLIVRGILARDLHLDQVRRELRDSPGLSARNCGRLRPPISTTLPHSRTSVPSARPELETAAS